MSFGSKQVEEWRGGRPSILAADWGKSPTHLSLLLAKEVKEAEGAHTEELLLPAMAEHHKEIVDTLVFLYSFCMRHGIMPDFERVLGQVNGQGARSGVYDVLYQMALNLHEGNKEQNVEAFLVQALSLSQHTPHVPMNVERVMTAVTQKNTANRPSQYYSALDEKGQPLSREEQVARYDHTEKCLRMIRDFYHATLQPWMHEAHEDLIFDFRHSEKNIALLKQRLQEQSRVIASHISHSLRVESGQSVQPLHQIHHQLLTAGAVAI